MSLTIPNTFASGDTVVASEVNSNFTTVAQKFGNIDNSDIKASAGIDIDKLSASYEYMVVPLYAGTTTATGIVDYVPIHNDGKGAWTVVGVQYITADAGSTGCTFRVSFGYPTDASATFNTSTNLIAATAITASDTNYRHGSVTVTGSTITPSSNHESLVLNITSGGTLSGALWVSVHLKRQIKT